MSLPDVDFIDTDAQTTLNRIISGYENVANRTLAAGDPIRLFLNAIAYEIILLRNEVNYTGKQNLLAYATSDKLDHLAYLLDVTRNQAKKALTTIRFTLSSVQASNILIPLNTKVTDTVYTFQTTEVAQITAGNTYIDVDAECTTAGTAGNGIAIGKINTFIDVIPYVETVSNLTITSGGADIETDDSLRERVRLAPDSFSNAGSKEAYKFWALTANQSIIDVAVGSKEERLDDVQYAGVVEVYPLMANGVIPSSDVLEAVDEVLQGDKVRPLTDKVVILAPVEVNYSINLTYYIHSSNASNASTIQSAVTNAVNEFVLWQKTALGRDVNPSELIMRIMSAGAKRVNLVSPAYASVSSYQVAKDTTVTVNFGGFEQ